MICRVNGCEGVGFFFTRQLNRNRWFVCPSCHGHGTVLSFSPPLIRMHGVKIAIAKVNKRLDREEKERQGAFDGLES